MADLFKPIFQIDIQVTSVPSSIIETRSTYLHVLGAWTEDLSIHQDVVLRVFFPSKQLTHIIRRFDHYDQSSD